MADHYETLGIDREATDSEIKAAYRFGVKAFHPDKFPANSADASKAQTRLQRVVEAYGVLSNPRSRAEYDRFQKYTGGTARTPPARPGFWRVALIGISKFAGETVAFSKRTLSIPFWAVAAIGVLFLTLIATWILIETPWGDFSKTAAAPRPAKPITIAEPTPWAQSSAAAFPPSASLTPIASTTATPEVRVTPSDTPTELASSDEQSSESREEPTDSEATEEGESEDLTGLNENGQWKGSSPDGKLLALALLNAEKNGTRVAIFTTDGKVEKEFAQHFFTERLIAHVAWSPDSKFLLFTTTSAGGHSAWHYAAFVFSVRDRDFHKLDDDIGDVVRARFDFEAPNKALLTIRTEHLDDGPVERDVIVPLDKISFTALPRTSITVSPATPNFIRNGTFALGLAFWNAVEQATVVADPKNPENEALAVPILEGRGVFSQNLIVPPSADKLQLSFRVYQEEHPPEQSSEVKIAFFDSNGNSRQVARNVLRSQGAWETVTISLESLGQQMRDALRVEVQCPDGSSVLVDDFVLSPSTGNRDHATPIKVTQFALYRPAPEYPLTARQRRATGSGLYCLRVDVTSGRVKQVTMEKSTGDKELDNAAVTAFRKWRFKPGALRPLKAPRAITSSSNPSGPESLVRVPATFSM